MTNSKPTGFDGFEPMPKRFLVWDKVCKQFLRKILPDGIDMVFSIFELPLEIDCLDEEEKKQFIICQSTNLFDKDGKEIFEGSILEQDLTKCCAGRKYRYLVKSIPHQGAGWVTVDIDGAGFCPALVSNTASSLNNIGHILSNPELLEGNVNK